MDYSSETMAVKRNLEWFRNSGVMDPSDGSWGVAERITVAEPEALAKMFHEFPAWSEFETHAILEQRRADCNFQAAMLFLLAGEMFQSELDRRTGEKIVDFLYCRSGLLNRENPQYPDASWNWSHIKWTPTVYFDDNAWCIFLALAIARLRPDLDRKHQMALFARRGAAELYRAMHRTFDINPGGEWRDPQNEWNGRLELPHWGSLAVMALAATMEFDSKTTPEYCTEIHRYHRYLLSELPRMTVSEAAYAALGAAATIRIDPQVEDRQLLKLAGELLLQKFDPATGNIPAEHYEAPVGPHLVDTIYTVNWAALALPLIARHTGEQRYDNAARQVRKLLIQIQDNEKNPAFHGCWRGMFDLNAGCWGGGDCYEGGAGSIYTGWTNAPIALALLLSQTDKTLCDLCGKL